MNIAKSLKNKSSSLNWVHELGFEQLPKVVNVAFIKDEIAFILEDERIIYIPISWSKKLNKANQKQRLKFTTNGYHVFWDDIDEIIGVKNILFGKKLFV